MENSFRASDPDPETPARDDAPAAAAAAAAATDELSQRERAAMARAMRYLRRHYRRRPSLVDVARRAHYSPFHFHRRFKQCFGVTPKQMMTALQIAEAKRLLLTGMPAAAVARAVGFAHQSHMTLRFRQVVGDPPARWRAAQRADARARA